MKKKEEKKNVEKEISSLLSQIFTLLEIKAATTIEKQEEDQFAVRIETEETGLLIGRHGECINSLQLLLGVMLYKKFGKWVRVILDVGDYRKMREDSLKEMVERIAGEVEGTGVPVVLPYLSPLERRFVHLLLTENAKVTSESTGEGKERRVTIKPR
ncbi:KH domain-containing protein [Candidatus Gottesmanbacteria bacterium]|nr:KH domain-containing protein [Candidatus Gottesmanbacteria bacterium]